MKVYRLADVAHYDGEETLGVFDSLEKAQAKAVAYLKQYGNLHKDKQRLKWMQFERAWRFDYGSTLSLMIEELEVQ